MSISATNVHSLSSDLLSASRVFLRLLSKEIRFDGFSKPIFTGSRPPVIVRAIGQFFTALVMFCASSLLIPD